MSRHRNVRNLVEDDYYDGYDDDDYYDDDYYDEEEEYNKSYAPPAKAASTTKTFSAKLVSAPKAKPVSNVGVTKAPPGWGKPQSASTVSTPVSNVGVTKAPPGWGKPQSASTVSTPAANLKVTKSPQSSLTPGTSKPPLGWSKPEASGTAKSSKIRNKSPKRGDIASSMNTYTPKPIPDFLRKQKSQLSMVILGHVDAGKSTLMGQILVQTNQISKREAAKQANLSWLLDENESERTRGVTMEIGTKTLRVPNHDIVVLE